MKYTNLSRRGFLRKTSLVTMSFLPLVGVAPGLLASTADKYGIKGKQAPPLSVDYWIDANGQPTQFDQQQLKEKWVYIKCFQKWCPGCHKHGFPALKKVADAFQADERVEVLAIQTVFEGFTTNTQESVREIQLQYELPIIMGHDPGDPKTDPHPRTMRDYRTGGTPWAIIIDPSGKVVFNHFHIDPDKFIPYLQKQLALG
ncbi:MAG: TlpA family protein disulfide reductase [Candidatus Thiodiazotropha sp. (ex Myrtea sp. 'scaly one' KF741663)]|nr:TlpA family protein disulfide reductase [Candidatus Thiodiazotropha sp. (ex Myrtea sp. 'scaly one' KF741663)]